MSTAHPAAFSHADLQRLAGYQRAADLERWCQRNGVRYFRGRHGIWTTAAAVNHALGIRSEEPAEPPHQRIDF